MTGTLFLFHYIGGERGVRTVAYASIDGQWHSALFFLLDNDKSVHSNGASYILYTPGCSPHCFPYSICLT